MDLAGRLPSSKIGWGTRWDFNFLIDPFVFATSLVRLVKNANFVVKCYANRRMNKNQRHSNFYIPLSWVV